MATIKSEQYIWNKIGNIWDLYYHRTSADLIVETSSYKVLTSAERTQISTYLTTFNIANKLLLLDGSGQISVGMIPGGLNFLPLAGGIMTGSINLNSQNITNITDLRFKNGLHANKAGIYTATSENDLDLKVVTSGGTLVTYRLSELGIDLANQKITSLNDPVNATDAANKRWVEQLVALGTHIIAAVRAASTTNITNLSGLLTIDGIVLEAEDRVLVKNQSTASQNGVYVVKSGAWVKVPNDSDKGSLVTTLFGNTQTRHQYYCSDVNTWTLYFIDDSYYAAASGGLALESDGFGFKIASAGVTNDMLTGSINISKLLNFTNADTDTWGAVAAASGSAGLSAKLTDIYSAIKLLRGTANFNTSNTQTISDLYTTIALKNRVLYGTANPPTSYAGEDGDIYLKAIV